MQVLNKAQGHFTLLSTLVSCFEPRTCIQYTLSYEERKALLAISDGPCIMSCRVHDAWPAGGIHGK